MSNDTLAEVVSLPKKKKSKSTSKVEDDAPQDEGTPLEMSAARDAKKKKKRKRAEKERKGETSDLASPAAPVQSDESQPSKRRKKDEDKGEGKKKRKEKREEPTPTKMDAVAGPSGSSTDMDVDAPEVPQRGSKKEKKSRKSKKSNDKSADVADAGQPSDDSNGETTSLEAAENSTDRVKTKKTKKKHGTADLVANTVPSPPQPASTSLSEAEAAAYLQTHHITIHSSATPITPIAKFTDLPVPTELLTAFGSFKEPTPIQACTWPAAFLQKDVVGIAETGSGKTLAFGIPALSRLLSSPPSAPGITTLIVAPTRELAVQTHDTLSALGEQFGIGSVAVFGGVPKEGQVKLLKAKQGKKSKTTARIVVGTPGRIKDLVEDGSCDLSGVDYLVLDEADRMLDKGFENDIRQIIGYTKQGSGRQTMMFSATWPEAVRRLASTFQHDPIRVTVGSDDLTANTRVEQVVEVFDDARSKDTRLLNHLRTLSSKSNAAAKPRILVFALYKKEASRVEQMLRQKGFSVGALHGDMSQSNRLEALENFKTGGTQLLVATDVAARGLDIPNVEAVINYTFPLTIEDYIHRIGRTGRGGKSGKSITFFTGDGHEKALAGELARVLRDAGFEKECEALREKFPMTIKKKTHSVYGAFFRDDIPAPKGPTKIVFE